jgi:hypothetical protein
LSLRGYFELAASFRAFLRRHSLLFAASFLPFCGVIISFFSHRHSERSEDSPLPQHPSAVAAWEEIGFAELRFAPVPRCARNDGAARAQHGAGRKRRAVA